MLKKWESILQNIDFAYQPIVDISTGSTIAYEALLRNHEKNGFLSIDDFFDTAYQNSVLYKIDLKLREKAIQKLKPLYEKNKNIRLFYNLDNRIIDMKDYENGHTKEILKQYGFKDDFIIYEISEKHQFHCSIDAQTIFNMYKDQGFKIALDDFGTGYSGLQMLYQLDANFIKIDRFFITNIELDKRKISFVKNIINLAHENNMKILAEGIETKEELHMCQKLGFDLAQGYYIQKPTTCINELQLSYEHIKSDLITQKNTTDQSGEILSLITHDLKSPMTAVLTALDMLNLNDLNKEEKKESIAIAKKASKNVLKLIENILTMVKAQALEQSIQFEKIVSPVEYFRECYNTFKYQAKLKKIKFELHIPSTLPEVYWDMEKIQHHVINNIISNSIKYTPYGGKIVFCIQHHHNEILITIQDNGCGIDKKLQKNIFEKYTTYMDTAVYKGKGLGLYNAYTFVNYHKGCIQIIKGLQNKGVGFEITLPLNPL
ncbi:MAG: EAL domain-containing protein [Campylobacterales bacterium]|nr:EAL domain-containing protein [Campylobacterales bacterium]